MCQGASMFWNEHGERVDVMISTSDAGIDDIPRVMREHRDLRKALDMSLKILSELEYDPTDPRSKTELDWMIRIKKQNPL